MSDSQDNARRDRNRRISESARESGMPEIDEILTRVGRFIRDTGGDVAKVLSGTIGLAKDKAEDIAGRITEEGDLSEGVQQKREATTERSGSDNRVAESFGSGEEEIARFGTVTDEDDGESFATTEQQEDVNVAGEQREDREPDQFDEMEDVLMKITEDEEIAELYSRGGDPQPEKYKRALKRWQEKHGKKYDIQPTGELDPVTRKVLLGDR